MTMTPQEHMEEQKRRAELTPEQLAELERVAIAKYESNKNGLAKLKLYAEMEDVKRRFVNLLGDKDGRAYVESVVIAVANNEGLQKCSPKSIMVSAMRAASLKLSVDPIMKQAHLVPMGSEATLIVDYHGLVQLSVNTGYYEIAPNVFEVYEGEVVKTDRLSGRIEIDESGRKSNKVIGWGAYFKAKNGTERWLYMTNEECDAHGAKYSKAYNSPKSGWNTDREKMRRKTALRILVSRWGNFSPHVQNVINNEGEIIDGSIEMPSDEDLKIPDREPLTKEKEKELIQQMGFQGQ